MSTPKLADQLLEGLNTTFKSFLCEKMVPMQYYSHVGGEDAYPKEALIETKDFDCEKEDLDLYEYTALTKSSIRYLIKQFDKFENVNAKPLFLWQWVEKVAMKAFKTENAFQFLTNCVCKNDYEN